MAEPEQTELGATEEVESEPDFNDPAGYVDSIPDEELLGDVLQRRPEEVSGLDSVIVVSNIPKVGPERFDRLKNVIKKVMTRFGSIKGEPRYPLDADGHTKGFMFLEYGSPKEAAAAVKAANGYHLDKQHIFAVHLFLDFEKYGNLSANWEPPMKTPYQPEENLRSWLANPDCHDQYAILHAQGEKCAVMYNTPQEAQLVKEREYWTESIVRWTPQGSYLVSLHKQGVLFWGGDNFERKKRFSHPNVVFVDFSPCERYLVTFNGAPDTETDHQAIIMWDIRTGAKKRSFNAGDSKQWPMFKWSPDGKYFARMSENLLSVYETPSFGLLDRKSVEIKGIKDFGWSPTDNIVAYWIPESQETPARVALMEIPSRTEIRTKNLFNVADCKMSWHKQGDYLAVKVERFINTRKKGTYNSFEMFRMREKQIPVDNVEIKEAVQHFAWEPNGNKFGVIHGEVPRISVSFYEMVPGKVKLIKTLEKKQATHLYWSPQGQCVVLAGLKQFNGVFEFYDTSDMTQMNTTEHLMATDLEWDPTGRYVITQVSYWAQKVDTGYIVWSLQGRLLQRHALERFCQLLWRPRPKSLLNDSDLKKIKKDMKKYTRTFEMKDRMRQTTASKDLKERRRRMMADYQRYRQSVEDQLKACENTRSALRGGVTTQVEEYDEETVEYFLGEVSEVLE